MIEETGLKDLEHIPKESLDDYIYNLWRTDEFKLAHKNPDSYVRHIIDQLTEHGRSFFTPQHDYERAHFSTWFNYFAHRHYKNPYMQDLYYFHEFSHLATMEFKEDGFFTWAARMQENELYAALSSEVFIHFFMRHEGYSIRDQSFPFRIWADKFLETIPETPGLTPDNFKEYLEEIVHHRAAVTNGHGAVDDLDRQLGRFYDQNFKWMVIWKDKYEFVERTMKEFYESDLSSEEALIKLHKKLEPYISNGVIFDEEAREFDVVYRAKNESHGSLNQTPDAFEHKFSLAL